MRLVDLVEEWATKKNWWCFKNHVDITGVDTVYINISKRKDPKTAGVVTLYDNGNVDCVGGERRLAPADPDFFLNLEYLVIEYT